MYYYPYYRYFMCIVLNKRCHRVARVTWGRSIAAGLERFAVAQAPQGLVALLSLKPRGLFISFARTKETKQRKFAVCTFCATPALFSAKQKELASLKQLFVFHAPKSTSASRPKSEAGPLCFFSQHRFARWGCGVFFIRRYTLDVFLFQKSISNMISNIFLLCPVLENLQDGMFLFFVSGM